MILHFLAIASHIPTYDTNSQPLPNSLRYVVCLVFAIPYFSLLSFSCYYLQNVSVLAWVAYAINKEKNGIYMNIVFPQLPGASHWKLFNYVVPVAKFTCHFALLMSWIPKFWKVLIFFAEYNQQWCFYLIVTNIPRFWVSETPPSTILQL